MFQRMGNGEVDVRALRALLHLGVPDFVPENDVAEISDLLRSPALERMRRMIQGINPGAGISRWSHTMVEQYGLDQAGYEFRTGTEAQCFGRFIDAVAAGQWVVIPLWPHHRYPHSRAQGPERSSGR